jgi:hypothetical protein
MCNYSKGQIYTIRFHNNTSLVYIGSTIQPLYKRMYKHKCDNNITLHKYIQDSCNNDWSACYIELYERFPCNSKQELEKREGEIIRQFKNDDNYQVINKRIECRTEQEWREDNKQIIAEKSKIYYETHMEQIKKYKQEYREKNADTIVEKKKEEYNQNKDKYLERAKQYNIKNQDKLKEQIICSCGGHYSFQAKSKHFKTKKHQAYMIANPE